MSRKKARDPGDLTKKAAGGGYEVGYCKPPQANQFQKGRSGNPRGRPPKEIKASRDSTIQRKQLLSEFERPLTIIENGKEIKVPYYIAQLRILMQRMLKGDMKAAKVLRDLHQELMAEQAEFDQEFMAHLFRKEEKRRLENKLPTLEQEIAAMDFGADEAQGIREYLRKIFPAFGKHY